MRYQPQQNTVVEGWIPAEWEELNDGSRRPIAYDSIEEAMLALRDYQNDTCDAGLDAPTDDALRVEDLWTGEAFVYGRADWP